MSQVGPAPSGFERSKSLLASWRVFLASRALALRQEAWRPLALGLVYIFAYVLLEAATNGLITGFRLIVPWNPLPALALALVAWGGVRYVPAVFIGVLISKLWLSDDSVNGLVIAAAVVAIAYSAGGYLLRRLTRIGATDPDVRDLTIFIGVALGCSVLAALADAAVSLYRPDITFAAVARETIERITGIFVGLVVVCPLLLQIANGSVAAALGTGPTRRQTLRHLLILIAVLVAILGLIFGVRPFDEHRMFYLFFLPALAVAMRYGLAGAVVAVGLVQLGLLIVLAILNVYSLIALQFQFLMLALAITILYVGTLAGETTRQSAALAERARALRRQSEALAEAQKVAATAELAGALAHELNQPLAAISNYARACRTLAERGDSQALLVESLRRIAEESARAGEFVRRMRDFFRTGLLRTEDCLVEALLSAALNQASDRIERLQVDTRVRCNEPWLHLQADRIQLGTVFDNLVKNALDALAERPGRRQLELRARTVRHGNADLLRIEVSDNGPGVPLELRPELFSAMATTKPQGMGLGLAMSRGIVERHGGRLWLDSPQDPTRFCMEFPLETTDGLD